MADGSEMVMRKIAELGLPTDGLDDAGWGEDTGDPEDTSGEDDTGSPRARRRILLAEDYVRRALRELQEAERGEGINPNALVAFIQRIYNHGHRMGHRRGFKRALLGSDVAVRWGRSRRMHEFRRYVIDRYRAVHHNNVLEGPGFYYGTIEAAWGVETNSTGTLAVAKVAVPGSGTSGVSPVIDSAFSLGIGDTSTTWFGGPHVMNQSDTNLQNPGLNLYADEVFIIEAVSAKVRGIRVQYAPGDIAAMSAPANTAGTVANGIVNGQVQLWDEAGLVLPAELFNQFSDSIRLARNLAETSSLHFVWQDKGIGGGGGTTTDALIDSFLHVPGSHEMNVRRTSGGAQTLDLPQGFVWCLDKMFQASSDQGGNGLFDAQLSADESMGIPFTPVTTFGLTPGSTAVDATHNAGVPTGFALYWELRLHGTALLPGRREWRERGQRMERL